MENYRTVFIKLTSLGRSNNLAATDDAAKAEMPPIQ